MLELLRQIRDELRALRQATESRRARSPKKSKDRKALALLLRSIRSSMGDKDFLARELIDRAATDPKLRAALRRVLGPLNAGSARRLGTILKLGAGAVGGGSLVVRLGESRDGALWKAVRE